MDIVGTPAKVLTRSWLCSITSLAGIRYEYKVSPLGCELDPRTLGIAKRSPLDAEIRELKHILVTSIQSPVTPFVLTKTCYVL